MTKIQVLDAEVIKRIAAGEVTKKRLGLFNIAFEFMN